MKNEDTTTNENQILKSMDLIALQKLHTRILKEIDKKNDSSRKRLLREFEKLAQREGLSTEDVLGDVSSTVVEKKAAPKKKAKAEKLPPIYFNPIDPSIGWSGRGRKPDWVVTFLENGGELERLKKQ